MNFSAVFIRRPVATILLMAGIGLLGTLAYFSLPVSDLPNVDFPTLSVSASVPGADPATMASSVATPLERQFTTIAGVDSMTSTNNMGSTNITMQFDLSRAIDGAAVDVQTAISAAMPLLPPGMPTPPSFRKQNPADGPIMMLALTSDSMPKWRLDEYVQTVIGQRISSINGVAAVNVMGSQKFAVRVQVDPEKLAARGIGINEVADAIRNWNVNLPTGTLWGPNRAYSVQANGQLPTAEDYKNVIVTYRNNSPVRLSELGIVREGSEDERTRAWNYIDGKFSQGINLMVMRQPGSNVIETNDAIREVLPSIQKQLPPTVNLQVRSDRSKNIREAFVDIQFTLALTLALVIMVIFLFLRKVTATLIPALALPFSLVGTFAVMYVLDYSMDNLSMMAIILSVGFVVDDAIVMLENIVRHIERGESPMEAALRGSREIWFTIISMTISLAAVFIPILFMGGVLGRLFREFAVTITVAVLISGFVSVTLTPMLASRILRGRSDSHDKPGLFDRIMEAPLTLATRFYELSLTWVVRHHFVMAIVFVGMVFATFWLFERVPKGFIPDVDADQLYINTEMAQGTSYEAMIRYQERINQIAASDPDVEGFLSSVGGGGPGGGGGGNTGRIFLALKPLKQRKASAAEIAARLRPKLSVVPGVRAIATLPPAIRVGGRGSNSSYQVTLQATDTTVLYREGQRFEREIAKLPSVLDINSDIQMRSPRVRIEIDRDRAATYNLDVQLIQQAIYWGYGSSFASTIYSPTNQYRVMLEVTPRYQGFADMVSKLFLKSGDGRLIPLDAVTHRVEDAGPQSINHSGQLPSVTISFNLKPGVSLGEAVNEIDALAREKLPAAIRLTYAGTAKAFQDSLSNMTTLLIVAILVVYIVLGILYESFIHPLTILSGLPAGAFGALITLMITGGELNLYAFVGLVLLIGLVKKNAIMQIDFALAAQRNEGLPAAQAIFAGCITRFRPIMMTTAAALLGAVPIAIGYGAGGEARRPLGLVVVGGLLFSQAITLYLTPVVYVYLDKLQRMLTKSDKKRTAPVSSGPAGATPALGKAIHP
jgi:HAE1 family hydrophobic/amphiphilic exporter-1